MTRISRHVDAVRWLVLTILPALCALSACGIPTTGAVEAGGPATGVKPTIWVYFLVDGALVAAPRQTVAPVEVESAVRILLQGPTEGERTKRMTTQLASPTTSPTEDQAQTSTDGRAAETREGQATGLVKVTTGRNRVVIELSPDAGKLSAIAAAQIICTASAAQRVAAPDAEPLPVTVSGQDGRRVGGTSVQCPGD
ncbi:hypothetical protein [Streptomyces sp. NPDC001675]